MNTRSNERQIGNALIQAPLYLGTLAPQSNPSEGYEPGYDYLVVRGARSLGLRVTNAEDLPAVKACMEYDGEDLDPDDSMGLALDQAVEQTIGRAAQHENHDQSESALVTFATMFSDPMLIQDQAQALTCSEVDALAAVLRICGADEGASAWVTRHAEADEEGNDHYDPSTQGPERAQS